MYQLANPHLQFQFARAHHGLAQAKCQATYLKIETGCSHQTIWTMAKKIKLRMKIVTGVKSPKPQNKEEEEPKTNDQPTEKCGWGPGCPFCKSQEEKEEQNKVQQQKMPPNLKFQKLQARRPKTLNLNMTKAKQQWEAEMERLNSKYNLDCFSDLELDSESGEGKQYCYDHGYEIFI